MLFRVRSGRPDHTRRAVPGRLISAVVTPDVSRRKSGAVGGEKVRVALLRAPLDRCPSSSCRHVFYPQQATTPFFRRRCESGTSISYGFGIDQSESAVVAERRAVRHWTLSCQSDLAAHVIANGRFWPTVLIHRSRPKAAVEDFNGSSTAVSLNWCSRPIVAFRATQKAVVQLADSLRNLSVTRWKRVGHT